MNTTTRPTLSPLLLAVLALLSAFTPLSIDMYLPALPEVASDLKTTEARAALTLTSYFIAFGIAQMVYGPMADAVGRKPPLVIGVAIFLLATTEPANPPYTGQFTPSCRAPGSRKTPSPNTSTPRNPKTCSTSTNKKSRHQDSVKSR